MTKKILMGSNPACQFCGSKKHVHWFRDFGYICSDCLEEEVV